MIIWSLVLSLPPRIPVLSACLQVLVMTHEAARLNEMDDYFALKFFPLEVYYVMGRSYKMEAECQPKHTLWDAWKDLLTWRLFRFIVFLSLVCTVLFVRGVILLCSCSLSVNDIPTPVCQCVFCLSVCQSLVRAYCPNLCSKPRINIGEQVNSLCSCYLIVNEIPTQVCQCLSVCLSVCLSLLGAYRPNLCIKTRIRICTIHSSPSSLYTVDTFFLKYFLS